MSGAIPSDSAANITIQTQQVLAQLDERLAEADSSRDKILSATIWMHDVNRDVDAFNAEWNEWVIPGRPPARSCIQSTPQRGVLLEIALVAAVQD
ncbi:RidA family protein [Alcaligenaceae bacterium]|nr:RidA family protein [Alcaligenaceae bacterium]